METDPRDELILWSDEHLAIVDKPAGLVVHPASSYSGETLVDRLGDVLGGGEEGREGIVHRLDRDTSGLLVVSRDEDALSGLQGMIRRRELTRIYLALVAGTPESRTGTIEAPIGRSNRDRRRMAVGGAAQRQARTHFEVTESFTESSLLQVKLDTGRTHQIRVHMAAIGHPIEGDPEYGRPGRYGLDRQFLHSHRLEFAHPVTGEQLAFTSELPKDLQMALSRVDRRDPG